MWAEDATGYDPQQLYWNSINKQYQIKLRNHFTRRKGASHLSLILHLDQTHTPTHSAHVPNKLCSSQDLGVFMGRAEKYPGPAQTLNNRPKPGLSPTQAISTWPELDTV